MLGMEREETRNLSLLKCLSSLEDSAASDMIKENNDSLNLKATELTLGPPRCQSLENDLGFDSSKDRVCSSSTKIIVSGNKRVFSDTICELVTEASQSTSQENISVKSAIDVGLQRSSVDQNHTANDTRSHNKISSSNNNSITPAAKAEVAAGWPPIKVKKCSPASTPKTSIEVDRKQSKGVLYVKVSMYGAPFLRKVDLRSYSTYQELSSALQKMFNCFTLGTCAAAQETSGKEIRGENSLTDEIQSSKHVLTFEDKDGDWMLVGDVPWEMFIGSCKKLKIMKGSDAIGLASGAIEQSKKKMLH